METRNLPPQLVEPEGGIVNPGSAESEQDVYYGDQSLIDRYLKAAELLGVQDQVTLLSEKPEWSDAKVRIKLNDEAREGFFKKVVELEDQEGL